MRAENFFFSSFCFILDTSFPELKRLENFVENTFACLNIKLEVKFVKFVSRFIFFYKRNLYSGNNSNFYFEFESEFSFSTEP